MRFEEPRMDDHHHQPEEGHRLNEMSQEEQEIPLLAGTVGQERGYDVYVRNSTKQISALIVQAFAMAFVILIWGLVLSQMPLNPLPLFGYHPIIQSLSFLLFLQSILTLQPTSLANQNEKQKAFSIHRSINLFLILPLLTIGASIMWYLHHQPNANHFISWHGILGTFLIVWCWLQIFFGIFLTSFPRSSIFRGSIENAKRFYKWHRISGYFLLILFTFVLFLGATQTSWSQTNASSTHHVAVTITLLGSLIAIFVRINRTKLPKFLAS